MKSRHVIVVDIASVTPGYSLLSEGAWVRNNINGLLSDVDCEHESSFNDPPIRERAKERAGFYEGCTGWSIWSRITFC